MEIVTKIAEMKNLSHTWQKEGLQIGFVPTMGYLHQGHLSLMAAARQASDRLVASIFVNPTQFGPNEDYERYPRDLQADAQKAESMGVDVLFCPEAAEMYPENFISYVEPTTLADYLCGKSRPGHFRGVCTVVLKLFNIVQPARAYFGQKDAQQYIILRQMAEDLNLDVQVLRLPIVREEDGLALSSRNVYLSTEERAQALVLSRAVHQAETLFAAGERQTAALRKAMLAEIGQAPLARLDYLELVDLTSLEPLEVVNKPVLCAMAVFFGKTRLIDNTILTP